MARGVILSNLTLVLQHVSSSTRGNYTCLADNTEGSVTSNSLSLDIKCKYRDQAETLTSLTISL